MIITKEFTFDMGHRLPNHSGKCRNIHGHTYKLQISIDGIIKNTDGDSDEGMVVDFGVVKGIVKTFIDETMDHYFMAHNKDIEVVDFIAKQGFALTVVPFVPTAENMVNWIYDNLSGSFEKHGVRIANIKLWETPTSFADKEFL